MWVIGPRFEAVGFCVETRNLSFAPLELHPTDVNLSVGAPVQKCGETSLELEFLLQLRGDRKFPSPEELKAQIMEEVTRANKYFHRASNLLKARS